MNNIYKQLKENFKNIRFSNFYLKNIERFQLIKSYWILKKLLKLNEIKNSNVLYNLKIINLNFRTNFDYFRKFNYFY